MVWLDLLNRRIFASRDGQYLGPGFLDKRQESAHLRSTPTLFGLLDVDAEVEVILDHLMRCGGRSRLVARYLVLLRVAVSTRSIFFD